MQVKAGVGGSTSGVYSLRGATTTTTTTTTTNNNNNNATTTTTTTITPANTSTTLFSSPSGGCDRQVVVVYPVKVECLLWLSECTYLCVVMHQIVTG